MTRFFEGYFVFGRSYPWIVSLAVSGVITLLVVHAMLAVRKFPISYRQFRTFRAHMGMLKHEDTTLWFWQVVTGFAGLKLVCCTAQTPGVPVVWFHTHSHPYCVPFQLTGMVEVPLAICVGRVKVTP